MPLVRAVRKTVTPPASSLSAPERRLARVTENALNALPASVQNERLILLLRTNPLSALSAIDFSALITALSPAREILAREISNSANAHATQMHLDLSFDTVDPHVTREAELGTGRMITAVTDTTREAVRRLVATSFATQALTVDDIAKVIRESIGLTPRQALALQNAYERALADGARDGLTPRKAQQRAEKLTAAMRKRGIASRALTIARTEVMGASNAGKMVTWRGAHADGLIRAGTTKEWVTTATEACDICVPRDGLRVPWDGQFPGVGEMPPAHPNCRCTAVLRKPETAPSPADLPPPAPVGPAKPETTPSPAPAPAPLPQRVRTPNRAKSVLDDPALANTVAIAAHRDQGNDGDAALAALYARQGFNGLPTLVPAGSLRETPGAILLHRGITASARGTAQELAEKYRTGNHHPGTGWIANGTYATTSPTVADAYSQHLGDPGAVLTMSVPRDRVADGESLLSEQQEWLAQADETGRKAYADLGRYAVARGVDAIGFNLAGEQVVILLNRGIATVEEAAP